MLTLQAADKNENKIIINADLGTVKINKNIYGHFAEHLGRCIYEGFWVGEDSPIPNTRGLRNDIIEALKDINPPVIRWPGGCFADTYHWMDGIGPREKRPSIINTNWGGVTEDNSFGTHEFLDLCEILGAEPYICVNVGSGTLKEASDWVEYVNSNNDSPMTRLRKENGREKPWNVKYWAVGNESWGCGGNMEPAYYADNFKRYSTFMHGRDLFKVASGGTDADYDWTETVMKKTQKFGHLIQGYSFHYYSVYPGWNPKSSATEFKEDGWFGMMETTFVVDDRLKKHIALMDEYDPTNKIGLIADEWGSWYEVEPGTNPGFLYQQNTLRDAVMGAIYLNIFNNNAERVKMANIAQTVNVLQAMILTKAEQLVKTPTFYLFKMYKVHQDATMLPLTIESEDYEYNGKKIPSITSSASQTNNGDINISLANVNPNKDIIVDIDLRGIANFANVKGEIITSEKMNDYNDFGKPEKVNIKSFSNFKLENKKLTVTLPSKSVVTINLK
ncbi:MAG: alpha-N-arabinofuranosidase [Ignavibacteriales bacterium]|nr:alpha-N-arabinofuranosidase [Ignavibacteriota bacterium]MCB9247285.1 alpha-N-arabinofuranosidase [Ignavibacteriales bacterium]